MIQILRLCTQPVETGFALAEVNGSPAGTVPAEPCIGGGAALRQVIALQRTALSKEAANGPQSPFDLRHKSDTTGRVGLKSEPKIAFGNKGLMIAIYDVLETKSDIDWF
ncbi:hypothetical protein HNQ36_001624 [Afipia massiliensis]|uniref:Uncharacterized protein n=1 Tax=Afipia massiliensis TaxID=211460 RepID=A0A840MY37_9BRAD|nr:hypothetical protein [Afipia massiliensis]MBB5051670.1 hypothetical protein [Afipia massiliensis]